MYLKKAGIKDFGRFSEKEITFGRNLNVVFGSNESGKTTLNWFIRGMLYGLDGGRVRKSGLLPPARKYEPWNGNNYGGYLEYVLDNGSMYRIERDFRAGTTTVYDQAFNDVTHQFGTGRNKAIVVGDKHLGIDETGFEKTVFVDQLKTNPGEESGAAIMDRLSNACLSGDEEVSLERARKALQDSIRESIGTDKTKAKPLNIVVAEIEKLMERKEQLLGQKEAALILEKRLAEYKRKTHDLKSELQALEKAEELTGISQAIAEKKQEYKRLQGMIEEAEKLSADINSMAEDIITLEKTLGEAECFSECAAADAVMIRSDYRYFKGSMDELESHEKRLDSVNKRRETLHKQIQNPQYDFYRNPENVKNALELSRSQQEKVKENEKAAKSAGGSRRKLVVFACIAVLMTVLTIAGFYPALLVAIPAAVAFFRLYKARRKKKRAFAGSDDLGSAMAEILRQAGVDNIEELIRKSEFYNSILDEISLLDTEVESLEKRVRELDSKAREVGKAIAEKLRLAGLIDGEDELLPEHVEAFAEGVEKYDRTERELLEKRNELAGKRRELEFLIERMGSGKDDVFRDLTEAGMHLSRLHEEIGDLQRQRDEKRKLLYEGFYEDIIKRIDPLVEEGSEGMSALKKEKELLGDELGSLQLDIREYETKVESTDPSRELQDIEGELAVLEQKRQYLEETALALRTALEIIDEAAYEIQNDYAPILNDRLGQIIAGMTRERYHDLRADGDMRLNAQSPESGKIVSVANLSGGTIDQMYLALRIAVSGMISDSGESLPLVLDEPFAQYDDTRLERTLEYLMEIADKRQIIISTCKERELEKALEISGGKINVIRL